MPPDEPTFAAPTSLDGALNEVGGGQAILVGGGTSIGLLLKNRLVFPRHIVYLGRVRDLANVEFDADHFRIGASVTLRELARSAEIRAELPVLADAASQVGNPRVRAVATLGGAIVHGDPRQDVPPVLLALEAWAVVAGPHGKREIPVSELYTGFMQTAVAEDEIVTHLCIPRDPQLQAIYARFTPDSADDYPTVGVAVAVHPGSDGTVARARVALASSSSVPLLADRAGALMSGRVPSMALAEAVAAAAAEAADPPSDHRGSAAYRRAMIAVWTRRAVLRATSTLVPESVPG